MASKKWYTNGEVSKLFVPGEEEGGFVLGKAKKEELTVDEPVIEEITVEKPVEVMETKVEEPVKIIENKKNTVQTSKSVLAQLFW